MEFLNVLASAYCLFIIYAGDVSSVIQNLLQGARGNADDTQLYRSLNPNGI